MKLFGLHIIKDQAAILAESLVRQLPPKVIQKRLRVLSVNKITSVLESIGEEGRELVKTHKMGWIKRAYLANTFKWKLLAAGYETEFSNMATNILIHEMFKKVK